MEEKMYTIGQISRITGIATSTIRFYDKEGIISPNIRDDRNRYRYYSEDQLEELQRIRDLKSFGLSLSEIRQCINCDSMDCFETIILKAINKTYHDIIILQDKIDMMKDVYDRLASSKKMIDKYRYNKEIPVEAFPIETIKTTGKYVISIRKKGTLDAEVLFSERCLELQKIRNNYNLISNGPYCAIFHDGYEKQFRKEVGDLEVCLPVIRPEKTDCDNLKYLEGQLMASTIHVGEYAQMKRTYDYLNQWLLDNGYVVTGPACEMYLLDLTTALDCKHYVTRILLPVVSSI